MCIECLKEAFPERLRSCLESGSYLINYNGCHACKDRSQFIAVTDQVRTEDEEDIDTYEEAIEYIHRCSCCKHIIAHHFYQFRFLPNGNQEYMMTCALCGKGQDTSHAIRTDFVSQEDSAVLKIPTLFSSSELFSDALSVRIVVGKSSIKSQVEMDEDEWED